MTQRRSARLAAKTQCIEGENTTICKLTEDDNFYMKRKNQQVTGSDGAFIKKDGIDYNGSDPLIAELFDPEKLPSVIKSKSGIENIKRSYIYIISKKIDTRTFLKIGVSNTTSLRLSSLQTALIPGLQNIGFKLHYLFFYKHESSEKIFSFAEQIEQHLHKLLRNHENYKKFVIHFPTNKPSEWYLPASNTYNDFINFVLDFISVQTPTPERAYHFCVRNKKNAREYKDKFLRESTRQDVLQYRKDHMKLKGEILAKRRLTQEETALKKGNKQYFLNKLVDTTVQPPPLDNGYEVIDIYYHKTKSDSIRIHGDYYAKIHLRGANKKKPAQKLKEMRSYLNLDFSMKEDEETVYFTHIYNLLVKMKELGTLETHGLLTNYNHYFTQPIYDAKKLVASFENKDVSLTKSQVNWLIGRHVKDNTGDLFMAVGLVENKGGRIEGVNFVGVNSRTLLPEEGADEQEANALVAIELAIAYHENKLAKYSIKDKYEFKQPEINYDMYDFIVFDKNFFSDFTTKAPDQTEYNAIVLQNYYKYDKTTEKFLHYYDILFEDELWYLETEKVDKNSKKIDNPVQKKLFIKSVKDKKNLISKLIKDLGLTSDMQSIRQTSTNKTMKTPTKTTGNATKKKSGKQKKTKRKSARIQKQKRNTTMKLRDRS